MRHESISAITQLQTMKLRTALLSGNAEPVVHPVGGPLRIDHVEARLLPDEKVARVESLMAAGGTVARVGDGINDAPALARAHVGVAVGSGTDAARESADAVLLGGDLCKLAAAIHLARRCRSIIWFDFAGTLVVDGPGMILAASGMLTPLFAAFIHVGSELAFILNSARLPPHGIEPRREGRSLAAIDSPDH